MGDDTEDRLRDGLQRVRRGQWTRRRFVQAASALGVDAGLAAVLLTSAGLGRAQASPFVYAPTRRGGGGTLRILSWQGATLLNPHFSSGAKDQLAARLFLEPLAAFDVDGSLTPVLCTEVPSVANGGVAPDGRSVTFQLKRGVHWHDGEPFTADDVVFTFEMVANPESSAFSVGSLQGVAVRKVDRHAVRLDFPQPRAAWADIAVLLVLPRRHFAAYGGSRMREAPANLRPVGTGPYRIVDFCPGDLVRGEANPAYHMPHRPHFDAVEIKGGGDSVSAARAVLQTGEYDVAWMLQVEDELLRRMEAGGRGRVDFAVGGDVEFLMLNHADPWTEVDGERSHPSSRHPILRERAVRDALMHLVDRESIERFVMGRGGVATGNFLVNPPAFTSQRRAPAFDPARANALLDAAGWVRGSDGIRVRDGRRLKLLYHTTSNAPRQKVQATIKSAARAAGIEMDLKATVAAVYFSADAGNPDTSGRFLADLQMHTATRGGPDPARFMELFCSWLVASKANQWIGRNQTRWRSDEYDRVFRQAESELDPVRRAALLVRLNDIVCTDGAVVPLFVRTKQTALARRLHAPISPWGAETGRIHDWYRSA